MDKFSFSDLIDIRALKSMQDSFAKYTGLAICVVGPNGLPVVRVSGGAEFCQHYVKGCELGSKRCAECDKRGEELAFSQRKALHYKCHAGMTDFVIPITFENRVIGAILAGQVRTEEFDPEKARADAEEFGIDPEVYLESAMKVNYMSSETAARTADFLSEFADALSIMAHTNYVKNKKYEKTERIVRSQSNYITGLTADLKKNMRGWLDGFRSATMKYSDIPEVRRETDELLSKGQEVYSIIGDSLDYIRMSGGIAEYSEGVYDIRELIGNTLDSLRNEFKESGVSLDAEFDSDLPETLAGNSGRISQIVRSICTGIISTTEEGGNVGLLVSCKKTKYSCNLIIKITGAGTEMTEKAKDSLIKLMTGSGENAFENDNLTINDTNLPIAVLLLKQMSGIICAERLEKGSVVLSMTIPQLDGAKQRV